MKTLKFKLGLIVSTIMLMVFIVVLLYYNSILKDRAINSSVQILSNLALEHESELLNEIENAKAKSDVLALIFSKNVKTAKLNTDTYKLLSSVLENDPKIYSITIAYVGQDEVNSDSSLNVKQNINQKMNYLNVNRSEAGIVINADPLTESLKEKLLKKDLANKIQGHVFEPVENKDGDFHIPVLTPIFSGQKYLGYIQLNISLSWFNEEIILDDKLKGVQIYFVSSDGEIVAANNKKFIIGDKISSICPSCSVSFSGSSSYNVQFSDLTYCYPILLDNQDANWHICYKATKSQLFDLVGYHFWNYFLIALFLLTIGIVIIFFLIDYLMRPFKMLIGFAQKVAVGDFKCEQGSMEIVREDEFGQLQKAFRSISEALEETAEVSNAIALGDFSKTVEVKSDQDLLASSINKMNDFLKQKKEDEERNKSDEEKQQWFNKGISLMSEVIKRNQDNTEVLADKIVKSLVEFLDIALGGIYIKELTDDEKIIYRLIAAYAYSEQKFVDKYFQSGESLVGSCASEKRIIYMSSIPEDYMKIFSGLGESVPQGLLLIPIIYNDEVFGVLELAALKKITEYEQKFLQEVADNIASTLSLTQISSQTVDLLEKSRLQAVELEKRDKEMINTLDELRELQKETEKRETEVRSKITAMNNSLLVVEYTTDGIVLDANQKYLNSMNFTLEEIKGVNVLELLQEKEKKELTDIINTVKRGNFYEAVVKRHTKYGKEKWLLATYTPVLDETGETSSILFFATDISRTVAKEQHLQKQFNQLKSDSEITIAKESEIVALHAGQKNKMDELTQLHRKEHSSLVEKMNKQKAEGAEKVSLYEKMISEIVNQWSIHIDNAEKMIKKK